MAKIISTHSFRGGTGKSNTTANLAVMVANKEDLVRGQTGDGSTAVMSGNKAIEAYRNNPPSGMGGATVGVRTGAGVQSYTFSNLRSGAVYSVVVYGKTGRVARLVAVP